MRPDQSDQPASRSSRKTWVSIIIASVIIVGILAISAVGGTAYFFYRHIHTQLTPPENADTEFAETRARFAGQQALIEIRRGDEPILHRELVPRAGLVSKPLDSLRVLA